jgi:elongation factor 1-alpha
MATTDKEHLSVVVTGHVDAGKSTTTGHLIFKLGGISDREMSKLQAEAEEKGKSSFGFAYYLDTGKEERERGVTIQSTTKEFFTENYHYTIVDAPGHKDYRRRYCRCRPALGTCRKGRFRVCNRHGRSQNGS